MGCGRRHIPFMTRQNLIQILSKPASDAMWDNEILARAREEQLMINTSTSQQRITPTRCQVEDEKNRIIQSIQAIVRRRAIHKVAEDIENVATNLRPFLQKTVDLYQLSHPQDHAWVDTILEEIRGAIYTMVHDLSQKNIRVSVTQAEHKEIIRTIRVHLATLSTLMNDDCIELDVNMDCTQDERIARRIQREWEAN
jgi:hypothetical protein